MPEKKKNSDEKENRFSWLYSYNTLYNLQLLYLLSRSYFTFLAANLTNSICEMKVFINMSTVVIL